MDRFTEEGGRRSWVPGDEDTPGHWLTTFDAQVRVAFDEVGTILHVAIDDGMILITANCDPLGQAIVAAPPTGASARDE